MSVNPALLRWRKTEIPYAFIRNCAIKLDSVINPKTRMEMRLLNNADLAGKLDGQRCFILGNGPSLKNQNMRLLEDEIVFTCNSISQMKDFKYIKPSFHFWMDPNFFIDDSYIGLMKSVDLPDNHPIVFFPTERRQFVEEHKLYDCLNVRYFKSGYTIYEGYNRRFDYCRILPLVTTVVVSEIFLAIYMGAKEIYLLGCDCTGAISHIKSLESMAAQDLEYAYEMSEQELGHRKKAYEADGNEFFFYLQSKGFQHYRILNEYCNRRGIKLVNCTDGGILNEIPRERLENVLRKN